MSEENATERQEFITIPESKFMFFGNIEVEIIDSQCDYERNCILVTVRFPDGGTKIIPANYLSEKRAEDITGQVNIDNVKFTEIPFGKITVGKDDVIVFYIDRCLTMQELCNIRGHAEQNFPGNKIAILDGGLKMGVINKTDHIPGIDIDSYANLPTTNDDLPF